MLILLGLVLITIGMTGGGLLLLAVWLGCDFLVLGIAHARGAHGIFGKRQDGSIPVWSWLVFLPLFIYIIIVWHVIRIFSREPALNRVSNDLVIGRRLLPSELEGEFENYIDLTAEFVEPAVIRQAPGYYSYPILDGAAPEAKSLRAAVDRLRPGRTFIHCAQGHGRTGLFALAVLLKCGLTPTVDEGLRMLRAVRPGVRLNRSQRRCIEDLAAISF